MWDINNRVESFSPSHNRGGFLLKIYFSPQEQKREQLSLLSRTQTSILSLSQFLDELHLQYVSHNHDITHLLVLLP